MTAVSTRGNRAGEGRISGTVAGLALVAAFGLLPLARGEPAALTSEMLWASDAMKWGITLLLLIVVVLWERRRLRSVGLRSPRLREVGIGLTAGVGWLLLAGLLSALVMGPLGLAVESETAAELQGFGLVQRVSLVAAAAVSEEVCFRGFLMERVEELTGRSWLAVVATVALFVGGHVAHFDPVTNLWQILGTLVLAFLYLWRRDLTAPIVVHAVVDGWGLILMPALGI